MEIKQALNNYFNIEQPDFSHLKQITPFEQKVFSLNLTQLQTFISDGFKFKKKAYHAIDQDKKPIDLPRFTWIVVAHDKNDQAKYIVVRDKIYQVIEIRKKLVVEDTTIASKVFETVKNKFIDNGTMIINGPTFETIFKMSHQLGYKAAVSRKYFLLDNDCQNLLNKKRALLKEIETLRSKLY